MSAEPSDRPPDTSAACPPTVPAVAPPPCMSRISPAVYAPGVVSTAVVPGRVAPKRPDTPPVIESGSKEEKGMFPSRPPDPPAPPAAYATPPVPSIPDTTPAICTVMGRVIAMCRRSARNDANSERNDESDTLPVSIICCHAERQPESMPSKRPLNDSSTPLAVSEAEARYSSSPRFAPSTQSRDICSSRNSRILLMYSSGISASRQSSTCSLSKSFWYLSESPYWPVSSSSSL